MQIRMILGSLACAACVAQADIDLNGSWSFRFEEGKAIEETAGPAFEATDTMTVPGCYDTMPKWFLKRGTGLYRRTFTLAEPVENAWLVVDGMGLRGNFRIDGKDLGVHPYPYARLELETSGKRLGTIPAEVRDGKLCFTAAVDGPHGARMLYEVVRK